MTEEKKEQAAEGQEQKQEQTQTPQLSDAEQKAMQEGWRPKEEWAGDPEEWKDAKTFLRDGELFKKIEEVKRENKALKRSVSTIKGHYERVREVEYARAVEDLKAAKKAALVEGDADKVIAIDEELVTARQNLQIAKQATPEVVEPEQHPEFANWVQRNRWYETNQELREFADTAGFAHAKANPGKTPRQVLEYVEERVAKAFPEHFKNQRKSNPSTVEGGSSPRAKSSGGRESDITLSEDETKVMRRLVRDGVLTEEQYRKDLLTLEKQGKR